MKKHNQELLDERTQAFYAKYAPLLNEIYDASTKLYCTVFPKGANICDSDRFSNVRFNGITYSFGIDNISEILKAVKEGIPVDNELKWIKKDEGGHDRILEWGKISL